MKIKSTPKHNKRKYKNVRKSTKTNNTRILLHPRKKIKFRNKLKIEKNTFRKAMNIGKGNKGNSSFN